ncbi:MAG TPA: FAD-dependent oxidoreductase [Candidatus Limnocylindrales bacterium]|nr:FAD-dependent oxidoreductase [Candidatus Limnocylindrales bacterium]
MAGAARLRRLVERDLAGLDPGARRGWWLREALADDPGTPCPPPVRDGTADVVIVGGGFTGLWTAWWLLERDPGLRVTILERDIVGGGASGRNGGFLTGWWDYLPALVANYGPDAGLAAAIALDGAPARIGEWAARHGVDPWFTPGGTLVVSSSPAQDDAWAGILALARELGVADRYVELTRSDVQARCATPQLRGGMLVPSDASVQPARLARGLRRVLLERGVTIHEGTGVTGLRADGAGVRATTDVGPSIRAGRAVLAVNAWAAGWKRGGFGHRMITWSSYMVLTEPIPDRLAGLGWTGGEAITDCRFTNHYFRTTADGRIAFGGGGGRAGYGGRLGHWVEHDRGSTALAARGFRRIFPMLDDVALVDAWGGPIDISSNHLPSFGAMDGTDGRVLFGHGYSGTGVGPSWLGGRILAALARGDHDAPEARLPMVGHRPRRFPPEPFRFLGARVIREAIVAAEQRDDLGGYVPPPLRWLVRVPRAMGYDLGPE